MSGERGLPPPVTAALREVLEPSGAGPAPNSGNELVDALVIAAAAVGTPVSGERVAQVARQPSDTVEGCAQRLGIPVRRVTLQGQWWRAESGPYLVRLRAGGVAAAVPHGAGYLLVHEHRGHKLNRSTAAGLGTTGWSITSRLPERPVGLRELLRVSAGGSLRWDMGLLFAYTVTVSLLGLAFPLWAGWVIGELVPIGSTSRVVAAGALLVLVALAIAGFTHLQALAIQRIAARLDSRAVAAVIDRLLRLPLPFFRSHQTGGLVQRVQGLDQYAPLLSVAFLRLMSGAVLVVSGTVVMLIFDVRLAAWVLVLIAVVGVFVWVTLRRQLRAQVVYYERNIGLSGLTLAMFSGIAKIRASAAEQRVRELWVLNYAEQQQAAAAVARGTQRLSFTAALIPLVVVVAVIVGWVLVGDDTALGRFTSFLAAAGQVATALAGVLGPLAVVLASLPVIRSVRAVLQASPESPGSTAAPCQLNGEVEVADVSFSYGDVEILHAVRLRVEPGQFVALVGPSGSGKTTLTRLLLGLERPHSGEILYDGRPLARLGAEAVRREIGVVTQAAQLSTGSILENIIGASTLTEDDAWSAAELAGIAEDIRQMPMGMRTPVSDGAATFSGGQKQRILLARALVRRPQVLILDEATSALDDRTQAEVSDALQRLGVTRIVVAHRLTTIARADHVYVIDRGRIVQSGAFDALLDQPGLFAELVAQQGSPTL